MVRTILITLLLLIFITGCLSDSRGQLEPVNKTFDLEENSIIEISQHSGQMLIRNLEGNQLSISGSLADLANLQISQVGNIFSIQLEEGSEEDQVHLGVPPGVVLKITSYQSDIEIQGAYLEIVYNSTAGSVTLNEVDSAMNLRSGRGDIKLSGGSGQAVISGEHGILYVEGFEGSVSMTSIMGTLEYFGSDGDRNQVVLEVDHGPVRVFLLPTANQTIAVSTTSGYVTCIGNGLKQTVEGCKGQIGSGRGEVTIRTVSGRVDLRVQAIPGD